MGRPAKTNEGRTTLGLDPNLKRRATVYAVQTGSTLTEVIEAALRLYLAQKRKGRSEKNPSGPGGTTSG